MMSSKSLLDGRMKNLNAETKMDVLRKTASIISGNFGVRVIFRGNEAKTDGKTIYVPSLPESADDDLIGAIIGFVDHEVGHILFTDFEAVKKEIGPEMDPRLPLMVNAGEDVRQEFLMAKKYIGAGINLDFKTDWTIEKIKTRIRDKEDIPPFNKFLIMAICRAGYPQKPNDFRFDLSG